MTFSLFLLAIPVFIWALYLLRKQPLITFATLALCVGIILGPEFLSLPIAPIPLTIDRVLWLGLFAMVVLQFAKRSIRDQVRLYPIDGLVLTYGLFVAFNLIFQEGISDGKDRLARFLFFQFIPLTWFWIGRSCRAGERELSGLAVVGLLFGVYLGFVALAERMEWYQLVFPSYIVDSPNAEFFGRARGPFINPIGCGIALLFGLGAILMMWKVRTLQARTWMSVAGTVVLIGCFCTMTRSVWLSTLVALWIVAWYLLPGAYRGLGLTGISVASLVIVLTLGENLNQFKRDKEVTVEQMAESAALRPMLFAVAVEMTEDKPFFGHGYGRYSSVADPYHRTDDWRMPLQTAQPYVQHSIFLAYLTELGIVGLLLFLLPNIVFVANAIGLFKQMPRYSFRSQLGLLLIVVNSAYLINGFFHDVSLIVGIGSILFFLNGVGVSANHMEEDVGREEDEEG